MVRVAYVFPGQGSQKVGMGKELYSVSKEAQRVFDEADEVLNFPLSKLCFEGPQEELSKTINAQPAILATSIAFLRASGNRQEVETTYGPPSLIAGHSLGEYTSLVAAGVLSFSQALILARERGRLMQRAGEDSPGGMAAIIGLDQPVVEGICIISGTEIANINSPEQIVISGPTGSLDTAMDLAEEKGAKRVIPLAVSGAFHSKLMEPAAEAMARSVQELVFQNASIPIIANTTAQPIIEATETRAELLDQLCQCVQWRKSVEYMVESGIDTFIEVGPGQVLSGLIKRIDSNVNVIKL
ncbi:MAG: ACP S-malonyltransferase [Chloroflexota bacterium]|nr:ACP S-malonyltransferase [Chloroflexota bacterium]